MTQTDPLHAAMAEYCSALGRDPLLVQGAGGNVSWKTAEVLWIKASGTWLAEAQNQSIFVPVALPSLRSAIQQGHFSVTAQALEGYTLRPSIETLLHALMPQTLVLHLHPVDALACLVRQDADQELRQRVAPGLRYAVVDYQKPGAELAQAVQAQIRQQPEVEVLFLKNHGILLGAANLEALQQLLTRVMQALQHAVSASLQGAAPDLALAAERHPGYAPCSDSSLHCLAVDPLLYARLAHDWALCPDHVVFLGAQACCIPSLAQLPKDTTAPFIFVQGAGVLEHRQVSAAQRIQLRFYRDLLLRIPAQAQLAPLRADQIAQLLNWDAEKYRMSLNQSNAVRQARPAPSQ